MSSISTLIKFLMIALFASLAIATPVTPATSATVATPVELATSAAPATPVDLVNRKIVVNGWFRWFINGRDRNLVVGWTSGECFPSDPKAHGANWASPGENNNARCWLNDKPDCAGRWSEEIVFPGGEPKIHGKFGIFESFWCECGDDCVVQTNVASTGPNAPPTAAPKAV